ncbi:MAG: hypothetical protein CMF26_00855 [Kiloniella sp.]|nr:hypothetical protein [Kiloniella sp.]RZO30767.1 MAG: precorrin-6A/cobalt-precorrin-6A reductase [Rhodospirillaceae bacterium]
MISSSLTAVVGWWDVPTKPSHHALILGGTRDARQLAEALATAGLRVTYALHAPTGAVATPAGCSLHTGSFGGESGLADFIETRAVTLWINALHPHAALMQARTVALAPRLGLPFYRLERPLWRPTSSDRWHQHISVEALIEEVANTKPGAGPSVGLRSQTDAQPNTRDQTKPKRVAAAHRLLLTVGPQSLADFLPLAAPPVKARLFTRRFDTNRGSEFDALVTWIDGLPDPSRDAETALIESYQITALVTKNSGGPRPAKLDAAAAFGLPVFLLSPPQVEGPAYTRWPDIRDAVLAVTDLR